MNVISPNTSDFFVDVPVALMESNILLYYIYRYEKLFNKKWIWIEEILKSIPILKVYKLDLKKILKLWIYIQVLNGQKFINNSNQIVPYQRLSNFDFLNYQFRIQKFGNLQTLSKNRLESEDIQQQESDEEDMESSRFFADNQADKYGKVLENNFQRKNFIYKVKLEKEKISEEYKSYGTDVLETNDIYKNFCENVTKAKQTLSF